jgi:serine/threonine protein kinase
MLAGYHPFKTIKDLIKSPPEKLPDYVPEDVKELVTNMLDKDPKKRMTIDEIKRWLYLRDSPSKPATLDGAAKEEAPALRVRNAQLADDLEKTKTALKTSKREAETAQKEAS